MTAAGSTATFDVEALRRGVEAADLGAMLGLYAEDAEMSIVDQRNTPSHPQVLRGREQIGEALADVFGREMTHRIDHIVVGDGTVSYVERCTYPDGTRVLSSSVLDLDQGKIIRQEEVQAWDSAAPPGGYLDFADADEVLVSEKRRIELVRTPAGDVARVVLEPGWRWSEHVDAGLCQATHFTYQIAGQLRLQMADGRTFDAVAGQVGTVPPGHDAWVIGDEPAILIDWAGAGGATRG